MAGFLDALSSAIPDELFVPGTFENLQDETELGLLNALLRQIVERVNVLTIGDVRTVATADVTDNAITTDGIVTQASSNNVDTTEEVLLTLSISPDANKTVALIGKANAGNAAADLDLTMRIRETNLSGAIVDAATHSVEISSGTITSVVITNVGRDATPSSSQVYVLTAQTDTSNVDMTDMALMGINLKK